MTPINKIKTGIESQNWDLICQAYTDLTGEEISVDLPETELSTSSVSLRDLIQKTIKEELQLNQSSEREFISEESVDLDNPEELENIEKSSENFKTKPFKQRVPKHGPVQASKKINAPFDKFVDPAEKKKNQVRANKTDKVKRPPKKVTMVKCGVCGEKFDFNKEYPMGLLESKSDITKRCNKCQTQRG